MLEAADREGRLMVLPCEVGAKIYRVVLKASQHKSVGAYIRVARLTPVNAYRVCKDFGKFVFLTLEEAQDMQKRICDEGIEKIYAEYHGG